MVRSLSRQAARISHNFQRLGAPTVGALLTRTTIRMGATGACGGYSRRPLFAPRTIRYSQSKSGSWYKRAKAAEAKRSDHEPRTDRFHHHSE